MRLPTLNRASWNRRAPLDGPTDRVGEADARAAASAELNRARRLAAHHRYSAAQEACDNALRQAPDRPEILVERARLAFDRSEIEDARARWTTLLSCAGQEERAAVALAWLSFTIDGDAAAAAQLEGLSPAVRDGAAVQRTLGAMAFRAARFVDGLAHLRQACRANPADAGGQRLRAVCEAYHGGDPAEALVHAERADPGSDETALAEAECRAALGDTEAALAALNRIYRRHGLLSLPAPSGRSLALPWPEAGRALSPDREAKPLVSIVMGAYDAASMIASAVASLQAQTFRRWELIVVDDASRDGTAERLLGMARRDGRIRVLHNSVNRGTYACRNLAIAAARGAYVTFQDTDDWSHPQRLARQLAALRRSGAKAVVSRHFRIDSTGHLRISSWRMGRALPTLFCKRRLFDAVGGFDPTRRGADAEFVDRLVAVYGPDAIVTLDAPLLAMAYRDGSLSDDDPGGGWTRFGNKSARHAYKRAYKRWHEAEFAAGRVPFVPLDAAGPVVPHAID